MRVESLMMKEVRSVFPNDPLREAARVMWERDCGFVPVVRDPESRDIVGVLTDRDICMASYTRDQPLAEISVESVMSRAVRICKPEDRLEAAEEIMREAQVRRLPVVDVANQLVGVISLSDIAREAARERVRTGNEVLESQVGETLATICQPREITSGSAEVGRGTGDKK